MIRAYIFAEEPDRQAFIKETEPGDKYFCWRVGQYWIAGTCTPDEGRQIAHICTQISEVSNG